MNLHLRRPRVKSPRLLPVVIFAGLALLGFKAIGLVTHGSYVLTGTAVAQASDAAAEKAGPSVDNAAPRTEPTMTDSSPTLADPSPTLGTTPPKGEGAGAAPGHGGDKSAPGGEKPAAGAPPAAAPAAGQKPAPAPVGTAAAAVAGTAAAPTSCPTSGEPATTQEMATRAGEPAGAKPAAAPTTANCDAVPMRAELDGKLVPMAAADGSSLTEQTLLQRLSQRRAELDKRSADLDLREAIVKAAEKQMQDRADALKALQAQIAQLNDQKKAMEDAQFASIVTMYATMKPQEAATIFDGLDMGVLIRVARAMDARKMSPILAKMVSARAQELTQQLAAADPQVADAGQVATPDANALPQIVGH